jgi:hypothetical protein
VVEDPREEVREQPREPDARVANRPRQRLARGGRAPLGVREHLQRALRGPAELRVQRQPGQRRIEVRALDVERRLAGIGATDVGMTRRDPIERPAPRRSEVDESVAHPLLADLDVDAKLRRRRQRHPDLAHEPCVVRKQARGAHQRAAPVGHPGAGGGSVEA